MNRRLHVDRKHPGLEGAVRNADTAGQQGGAPCKGPQRLALARALHSAHKSHASVGQSFGGSEILRSVSSRADTGVITVILWPRRASCE